MHNDDFSSFGGGFDNFGAASFDCTPAFHDPSDGYFDDVHTVAVDPWFESFNVGTADMTAISIRLQREHEQQAHDDAVSASRQRIWTEFETAETWLYRIEQRRDDAEDDVTLMDAELPREELADRLSTALANRLGYRGARDEDGWLRPTHAEWSLMPTQAWRVYNDAYASFARLVGKELIDDTSMTTEQFWEAMHHDFMLENLAELNAQPEPAPAPLRRLRIIRDAPY